MNHLMANANGIDSVIKKIQTQLYNELLSLWSTNINGYGRVYRNHRDLSTIPEAFISKEGDYQDTFYNDNYDANFFFLTGDSSETSDEVVYLNDCKVVFALDLNKCYNDNDRVDELSHLDAISALRRLPISGKYKIKGYETGLQNVFSGFSTKTIKNDDIHPTHVFAVNLELNYYLTDKCS